MRVGPGLWETRERELGRNIRGTPKSNTSRKVMQMGSRVSADSVWVLSRPCLLPEGKFGMCF